MAFLSKVVLMMESFYPTVYFLKWKEISQVNIATVYIINKVMNYIIWNMYINKNDLIFIFIIGLLVEPNLFNYQTLLGKQRKATSINACYAMTPLPTLVDFVNAKLVSGIQGMLCLFDKTNYINIHTILYQLFISLSFYCIYFLQI